MANLQHKLENAALTVFYPLWVSLHMPAPPKGEKIDLSRFRLVFEDDFSLPEIDKTKWRGHYRGVRKGGFWTEKQSFIENNQLHIRTEYLSDGEFGPGWYSDALETNELYFQTYGYFECRCILPAAAGMWSAFWLMPQNPLKAGVPGTSGMEIDVYESPLFKRKKNNIITSNLHYNGYGKEHRFKNVGFFEAVNPYKEFNTYGVEWNEREYIFYINGVETARSSFGGVSRHNEYMLLSTEVDGLEGIPMHGWSGIITSNRDGTFPTDFIVDYVRAYQYK